MPKIFTIAASPHHLQQIMSDIWKKFLLSRFSTVLNTDVDANDEFVLQKVCVPKCRYGFVISFRKREHQCSK